MSVSTFCRFRRLELNHVKLDAVRSSAIEFDRGGTHANRKKLAKMMTLSHGNRYKQHTATKTFASEDSENVRHHDRVLELGLELKGPSRRAYIFSQRTGSWRATNGPIRSTNSSVFDNFCSRPFRNVFARLKTAGCGTSLGPGRAWG